MPIKGLSERRRLPRVGKIHLGYKDPAKRGAPTATDYFVFPKEHPQYQELINAFGEKPQELRILIPLEDDEKFASQYYRCYSKTRGLICKGDGETTMRMLDTQTGALADRDSKNVEMKEQSCKGRECPDYQSRRCREIMNLQFLLPEITGLGVWQIDTSSINTIRNINSALTMLKAVYGRVSMLPLVLAMEKIEVVNPDDSKKKRVWVLNLKSPDSMIEAAKRAMQKPLEIVAGFTDAEPPVPDDELPELISPDWEGPAGDPIDESIKLKPGEAEELSKVLWPEQLSTEKVEEEQPDIPKTIQALYNWVASQGKKYNRTWVLANCGLSEDEIRAEPAKAYHELKKLMEW